MPTAKATSKSGDDGKVDTATSGPNAKASAKSKDNTGDEWVSKSNSKTDENGNTIVEKIFGRKTGTDDDDNDDSASSWTLLGSKSSREKVGDASAEADASTGEDAKVKASSGKASAGIVDGKAVATAG